jgi:LmbE family N-acetylglucosaminyl deacetylase
VISLGLPAPGRPLRLLCVGAHADDIEIGAGGLVLSLVASGATAHVDWWVLSAPGPRAAEATSSAEAFLAGAPSRRVEVGAFEDAQFPSQRSEIRAWLSERRAEADPDLVLVHRRDDAHQDHRVLGELAWTLFRDHLILEYEIPKWDGDTGRPNAYAAIGAATLERKIALLMTHFGSQRAKDWFDPEIFRSLARLRGMECRADERYAEAFFAPKLRLV